MKPCNVEIFDRNFRFRATALISENDFSYKYDYFSPGKNTITLPERIKYRQDSLSTNVDDNTVGEGDYIRITSDYAEITGVIVKLDTEDKRVKATFTDGLALFDHEVSVAPLEIQEYNIHDYIKKLLKQEFVDTTDTLQQINLSFSVGSGTYKGIFDYSNSDDPYVVINLLNDLIIPAFRYYLIRTHVTINVPGKVVNVTISKVTNAAQTIESHLPNVLTKKITVKQGTESANKLTVFDKINPSVRFDYYLHSNDYSYSTVDADRIIPVKNQVEYVDSEKITEEAFWHDNAEAEAVVNALLQKNATLTSAEVDQLQTNINKLWSYVKPYIEYGYGLSEAWYKENVNLKDLYYKDSSKQWVQYPIFSLTVDTWGRDLTAHYKDVIDFNDNEELYDGNNYTFKMASYASSIQSSYLEYRTQYQGVEPTSYSPPGTDTGYFFSPDNYLDETHSIITDTDQILYWRKNGKILTQRYQLQPGSSSYQSVSWFQSQNSDYSHLHIKLPYVVNFKANQWFDTSGWPDDSDIPAGHTRNEITEDTIRGYVNVPLTVADFNSAMDAYKASPEYAAAYAAYKAQMINQIVGEYVSKTFVTAKYANNIELSFRVNDSMVNPLNMPIGQEVYIIYNGVSYNSLLTGYEIKDGVIKLVFGTVRLDLTKKLNMKGV